MRLFTFPILPGKQEAWRRFCQELQGLRREAFEASCTRHGITHGSIWLVPSTAGEVAVVLLQGDDSGSPLDRLAASTDPFDRWFRRQVRELHGVELGQPLRLRQAEQLLDWQATASLDAATRENNQPKQEVQQ